VAEKKAGFGKGGLEGLREKLPSGNKQPRYESGGGVKAKRKGATNRSRSWGGGADSGEGGAKGGV